MYAANSHVEPTPEAAPLRSVERAVRECQLLLELLPLAEEVQWSRSVRPASADDDAAGRRSSGDHNDPTADVVADPGRLHVRDVVVRCEPILSDAAVKLAGVRRGLERALAHWEGE